MEKVALTPKVLSQVTKLSKLLLQKGYFSYLENAQTYANNLVDFIYSIPTQKHYITKQPRFGRYYCRYKANKHTTYYIAFDTDGTRYLIKNITTNHTADYARYIKGI